MDNGSTVTMVSARGGIFHRARHVAGFILMALCPVLHLHEVYEMFDTYREQDLAEVREAAGEAVKITTAAVGPTPPFVVALLAGSASEYQQSEAAAFIGGSRDGDEQSKAADFDDDDLAALEEGTADDIQQARAAMVVAQVALDVAERDPFAGLGGLAAILGGGAPRGDVAEYEATLCPIHSTPRGRAN